MAEHGIMSDGGAHRFLPGDRVTWNGREGTVVGVTVEPSDIIDFDDGGRLTIGQSLVAAAPGRRSADSERGGQR